MMLLQRVVLAGAAALSTIGATPAGAQGHAHVHGQAQLQVVLDGAELQLTLMSPLDSIVGFEHRPRTPAQRQAAETALRTLADPAQLFVLPAAAGCTAQAQEVEAPVLQPEAAGAKPHDHAGEHADLEATWRYRCAAPDRLDRVPLKLFERFSTMKRLEVRVAGPAGQGRQLLRRGAAAAVQIRR